MSTSIVKQNLKALTLGAMAGAGDWLSHLANRTARRIPGGLPVGVNQGTYLGAATATAVTKTTYSAVSDAGDGNTITYTTGQYYVPVELYDYEVDAYKSGVGLESIAASAAEGFHETVSAAILDKLYDASITNSQTMDGDNFEIDGSTITTEDNMAKLGSVIGTIAANNGGSLPSWIAMSPAAFGAFSAYSRSIVGGLEWRDGRLYYLSIPVFAVAGENASSGEWGDTNAGVCAYAGADDGLQFGVTAMDIGNLKRRDNGLMALDFSFTATYGLGDLKLLGECVNSDSP